MRRSVLSPGLLVVAILVGCAGSDEPVPLPEMPAVGEPIPVAEEPDRQFDFWLGEWNVQNKHLRSAGWKDSGQAIATVKVVMINQDEDVMATGSAEILLPAP